MRTFSSLSRCCCYCEDCCNGSAPDEFDVAITLVDDECGACDTLSGTYTLARLGTGYGPCRWYYSSGTNAYCDGGCTDPTICDFIDGILIYLDIYCISATQYQVRLEVQVTGVLSPGNPDLCGLGGLERIVLNVFHWSETFDRDDFDCTAVVDAVLPLVNQWSICEDGPSTNYWLCDDTPASVTVNTA